MNKGGCCLASRNSGSSLRQNDTSTPPVFRNASQTNTRISQYLDVEDLFIGVPLEERGLRRLQLKPL